MSRESTQDKWLDRIADDLSQKDLLSLLREKVVNNGKYPLQEHAAIVDRNPLEIFLFNQRSLLAALGGAFLILLLALGAIVGSNKEMRDTLFVLCAVWGLGTAFHLVLDNRFKNRVQEWTFSATFGPLRFLVNPYFLLDLLSVVILLAITEWFGLRVHKLILLILANALMCAACFGIVNRPNKIAVATVLFLLPLPLAIVLGMSTEVAVHNWFYVILYTGPLLSLWLMTTASLFMIYWLRTRGHRITQHHLALLGKYEEILSRPEPKWHARTKVREDRYSEEEFHEQVSKILEDMCRLGKPFWYRSACLWRVELHRDRGQLLLPGPHYRFKEAKDSIEGIGVPDDLLVVSKPILLSSINAQSEEWRPFLSKFHADLDVPAVFVPLRRDAKLIGLLALYGEESGLVVQPQEEAFLRSLGSIISSTMEQWEGRYRDFSQTEMDDLFGCRTLLEVFSKAVSILKEYLMAAGCMVIFRPDPHQLAMQITAKDGFKDAIYKDRYEVGKGQTGRCAELGRTIRCDDVFGHKAEFDTEYLSYLVEAHGKPIRSWMAIPIGASNRNYGVIQVVNRKARYSWFTDVDQRLGEALALRLHVIIEKFRFLKEIEDARAQAEHSALEARRHAEDAKRAQRRAEEEARQRQQDLMTITHQLQGPLVPVIGAISYIKEMRVPKQVQLAMEDAQALAQDAMILCYGIVTTFAQEAGQKTSFIPESVNAPEELHKLCKRLQITNSREDLTFSYYRDPQFPILRIDRNVFTCVIYSLIHNAMKYAEEYSAVALECSFERSNSEAALKVKSFGVPIFPNERDLIFQKFKRGRAVERGRHHSGVGLGLWVARQLMREIEGDLTVELSQDGSGLSVFIVHFPEST